MAKRVCLLIGIIAIGISAILCATGWSGGPDGDVYAALGFSVFAIGFAIVVAAKFS